MAKKYLIDSNAVIDILSANYHKEGIAFIRKVVDAGINISAITKIEILGFTNYDSEYLHARENFISNSKIFQIDDNVIDETISIRRKYKIKLPDAIIAATALLNSFILITHNRKDFNGIKGIQIIDPHNL